MLWLGVELGILLAEQAEGRDGEEGQDVGPHEEL